MTEIDEKIEKADVDQGTEPRDLDGVVRDYEAEKASLERQGELSGLNRINAIKAKYAYEAKMLSLNLVDNLSDGVKLKEIPAEMEERMNAEIAAVEMEYTIDGVCLAYCQMGEIVKAYKEGVRVEIEGFGPYLRKYFSKIFETNYAQVELEPEDEVGIRIMLEILDKMPDVHVVSLFDEYNLGMTASHIESGMPGDKGDAKTNDLEKYEHGRRVNESQILRAEFRKWVEGVLKGKGVIKKGEVEGPENDYVLVSETDKIADAKRLVTRLKEQGFIEGDIESETGEIWFQSSPETCEDVRYLRFLLRDAEGHWKCAALDASGYYDNPEEKRNERNLNSNIVSLVILPGDPMQPKRRGKQEDQNAMVQRAKVWEILQVLRDKNGKPIFDKTQVHDIFVVKGTDPEVAANVIGKKIVEVSS